MIIHGLNDEIWLENLDGDYKIIRIVSHHIHNKEQLDYDKFKLGKIVKQVKKKTFSLSTFHFSLSELPPFLLWLGGFECHSFREDLLI